MDMSRGQEMLYKRIYSDAKRIMAGDVFRVVYVGKFRDDELPYLNFLIENNYVRKVKIGYKDVYELGYFVESLYYSELRYENMLNNLLRRYNESVVDKIIRVFAGFAQTRMKKSISTAIKIEELYHWEKYPMSVVEETLNVYLDKELWKRGFGEKYFRGILDNVAKDQMVDIISEKAGDDLRKLEEEFKKKEELLKQRRRYIDLLSKVDILKSNIKTAHRVKEVMDKNAELVKSREVSEGEGCWMGEMGELEMEYKKLKGVDANGNGSEHGSKA